MFVFAEMRDHFAAAFFPRRSEWAGAALLILSGLILFWNPTLMASSRSNAFDLMEAIFRQETWAKLLFSFGLIRFTVLLINGAWRRSPHLRAITALLSCFIWMQVALSLSASFGLAFAAYAVFLGLEFSNIIVASRDARTVDDKFAGAKGAQQ
jgi:hypothetical protein